MREHHRDRGVASLAIANRNVFSFACAHSEFFEHGLDALDCDAGYFVPNCAHAFTLRNGKRVSFTFAPLFAVQIHLTLFRGGDVAGKRREARRWMWRWPRHLLACGFVNLRFGDAAFACQGARAQFLQCTDSLFNTRHRIGDCHVNLAVPIGHQLAI
jgi:hypothetical protein